MSVYRVPDILPPSEDGIFQSMLTQSLPALSDLLTDFLERKIKGVIIKNSTLPLTGIDEKRGVFDINCSAHDDHSQIEIEMQATQLVGDNRRNAHQGIRNRAEFFLCNLHGRQPARGKDYLKLVRSYQIMITKYNIFTWDDHEVVEYFTYVNRRGNPLNGLTELVFVDLSMANKILKQGKTVEAMAEIEKWVIFLAKAENPRYRKIIDSLIANKEGIKMANSTLMTISKDERERADFLSRLKWQTDRGHELASIQNRADRKYGKVIAKKDATIAKISTDNAKKDDVIAQKDDVISQKDGVISQKDDVIAQKDALIASLLAKDSKDK
jgi:predicted transposase/invertase (TIGR01784 family)